LRATTAELDAARKIQQALLPVEVPELPGFDLAGAWHPAEATCGDYFDIIPMGERYVGLVVGDVCGHGLGPALVMASTRACLRTLALTQTDVSKIMTVANRMLADDLSSERFVTMFFARLDVVTRSISYAGAGHRAYLMGSAGEVTALNSTWMPLGLDRDAVVPCGPETALSPGDMLVLVTDGVEDAMSIEGESFGHKKVMAVAREHRHEPAQRIVNRIIHQSVAEFTRGAPQDDDFTAVVLKVSPHEQNGQPD
jgi:serine phosphatase RsbU (regulator of sigma subunit)